MPKWDDTFQELSKVLDESGAGAKQTKALASLESKLADLSSDESKEKAVQAYLQAAIGRLTKTPYELVDEAWPVAEERKKPSIKTIQEFFAKPDSVRTQEPQHLPRYVIEKVQKEFDTARENSGAEDEESETEDDLDDKMKIRIQQLMRQSRYTQWERTHINPRRLRRLLPALWKDLPETSQAVLSNALLFSQMFGFLAPEEPKITNTHVESSAWYSLTIQRGYSSLKEQGTPVTKVELALMNAKLPHELETLITLRQVALRKWSPLYWGVIRSQGRVSGGSWKKLKDPDEYKAVRESITKAYELPLTTKSVAEPPATSDSKAYSPEDLIQELTMFVDYLSGDPVAFGDLVRAVKSATTQTDAAISAWAKTLGVKIPKETRLDGGKLIELLKSLPSSLVGEIDQQTLEPIFEKAIPAAQLLGDDDCTLLAHLLHKAFKEKEIIASDVIPSLEKAMRMWTDVLLTGTRFLADKTAQISEKADRALGATGSWRLAALMRIQDALMTTSPSLYWLIAGNYHRHQIATSPSWAVAIAGLSEIERRR